MNKPTEFLMAPSAEKAKKDFWIPREYFSPSADSWIDTPAFGGFTFYCTPILKLDLFDPTGKYDYYIGFSSEGKSELYRDPKEL
jgi:hypothetical protein